MRRWFPVLLAAASCASDPAVSDPDCPGGKCDGLGEAPALPLCQSEADFQTEDGQLACTPCGEHLVDESGRGFLPAAIANDQLVKSVYMTFDDVDGNGRIEGAEIQCPVDLPGIMAKLNAARRCDISSLVVSETAAHVGQEAASYRAVTIRDCRSTHELLFSSFGFTGADNPAGTGVGQSDAPAEVEAIAFDETEGVFNYYKEVEGKMRFFGSSSDFALAGPGGPDLTSTRGCANCHPGGGLVMKELPSPWTHWAESDDIPGARELVENRPYLGNLVSPGILEGTVGQGNRIWANTKADLLAKLSSQSLDQFQQRLASDALDPDGRHDLRVRGFGKELHATQKLLEPIFCTQQVNIGASGTQRAAPDLFAVTGGSGGLFPENIAIDAAAYDQLLVSTGSRVPGTDSSDVTTGMLTAHKGREETDYISALRLAGVVDDQLVAAIRSVDITRDIFSDERCELLALVPDVPPSERNPDGLREALKNAVKGATPGTPAGDLLAGLSDSSGAASNLQRYLGACRARDKAALTADLVKLRSLQRKLLFQDGVLDERDTPATHRFKVFEFDATMPTDDIEVSESASPNDPVAVHPGARLSPLDCQLVNDYVSLSAAP